MAQYKVIITYNPVFPEDVEELIKMMPVFVPIHTPLMDESSYAFSFILKNPAKTKDVCNNLIRVLSSKSLYHKQFNVWEAEIIEGVV